MAVYFFRVFKGREYKVTLAGMGVFVFKARGTGFVNIRSIMVRERWDE